MHTRHFTVTLSVTILIHNKVTKSELTARIADLLNITEVQDKNFTITKVHVKNLQKETTP